MGTFKGVVLKNGVRENKCRNECAYSFPNYNDTKTIRESPVSSNSTELLRHRKCWKSFAFKRSLHTIRDDLMLESYRIA